MISKMGQHCGGHAVLVSNSGACSQLFNVHVDIFENTCVYTHTYKYEHHIHTCIQTHIHSYLTCFGDHTPRCFESVSSLVLGNSSCLCLWDHTEPGLKHVFWLIFLSPQLSKHFNKIRKLDLLKLMIYEALLR